MNALAYLKQLPETQSEIKAFAEQVLNEVEARKCLPLLAQVTAIEKTCELIREGLKDRILDEADLEGAKSFEIDGNRFEKRARTNYTYHHCKMHEELKNNLKSLEKIMQTIQAPIADAETGEIIPPANKSFTDYVAVTLKK